MEKIEPVAWRMKTPHGWVVGKWQHNSADEALYPQSTIDALLAEVAEWKEMERKALVAAAHHLGRAERAEKLAGALQAKIDSLMLEYCPDEMTPDQIEEWKRHQVPDMQEGAK